MDNSNIPDLSFPFARFLQTGRTPDKEEVPTIRQYIHKSRTLLEETEARIYTLYDEAEAAKKYNIQLQSDIDACSSIISLARRIPDDVLREIFCQCLPQNGNAVLDTGTAPLVLTQICGHWRRIAHTTPALWTTVHIPMLFEEADERLYPRTRAMTEEESFRKAIGRAEFISWWLKLSGALPISISLFVYRDHGNPDKRPPPPHFVAEYIKKIMMFSSRWKSIQLTGGYGAYKNLASLRVSEVPCLESLTLALDRELGDVDEDRKILLRSGLLRTASLRKLRLMDYDFDLNLTGIHWSGLTHLTLRSYGNRGQAPTHEMKLVEMSLILKACMALISLDLYIESSSRNSDAILDISSMYLPKLRRLILAERTTSLPLFQKLEAPGLEEISFRSENLEAESVIATLAAQTSGNIKALCIELTHLDDHVFQSILRQTPNLRSLVLKQFTSMPSPALQLNDEFLDALASPASDGNRLCPDLEVFVCEFQTAFTYTGVLNFVKRKQTSFENDTAALKKFHICTIPKTKFNSNDAHLPESLVGVLKPFIDAGLDFYEGVNSRVYNSPQPTTTFSAARGWHGDGNAY